MAEGNTEQVTNSTDNFDIAAIAEELGIKTAPPAAPAADEKKPEPEASAETETPEPGQAPQPEDEDEQPAEESEETAEDDAEAEADEPAADDQDEAGEDPAPDKVQRRIDRLTAEKHELREERDVIKAELETLRKQAEAKPPVVTIDPENPLSSFTDASSLEEQISKAKQVLRHTDENRDGMTVTINGQEQYYDADAIKEIRRNAHKLVDDAPKQLEYIKLREELLPVAKATYPELFQQGTVPKAYLDASLKAYPWLTRFPGYELIVGDAFVGESMRRAKAEQQQRKLSNAQAKKSPAPAAKVPKTPSPAARPKVSGSEAALRHKADAVFKSGGNAEALTAYLEALV